MRPGITRRVRRTAFLRSFARPNKIAYRKAARAATREATVYAEENCGKYFEFQHVWPEIMRRVEGDRMLSAALLQKMRFGVRAPEGAVEGLEDTENPPVRSFDPGLTAEIRLNIPEGE